MLLQRRESETHHGSAPRANGVPCGGDLDQPRCPLWQKLRHELVVSGVRLASGLLGRYAPLLCFRDHHWTIVLTIVLLCGRRGVWDSSGSGEPLVLPTTE